MQISPNNMALFSNNIALFGNRYVNNVDCKMKDFFSFTNQLFKGKCQQTFLFTLLPWEYVILQECQELTFDLKIEFLSCKMKV